MTIFERLKAEIDKRHNEELVALGILEGYIDGIDEPAVETTPTPEQNKKDHVHDFNHDNLCTICGIDKNSV